MEVQVNTWAVVLAVVSSFVVGMVWYAKPVFGEMWRELIKMDKKTMEKGPKPMAWVLTVLGAALQAYVLAHVTYLSATFFGYSWMGAAMSTAFWMWAGFQLSLILTHDSFEQRPLRLSIMTAAHQFVTLAVMGIIIGLFKM